MKKALLLGMFLAVTACLTLPMAMAEPGPCPVGPEFKQPPRQEKILPPPKLEDFILNNTELKLTDKQKKEIEKSSKKTDRKVKKLDRKIRAAKEDKNEAISNHFKKIQSILTDEQKAVLKNQHKQRMEERKAKFEEFKKAHPNFKDGKRPHHPMKKRPPIQGEKEPQVPTK